MELKYTNLIFRCVKIDCGFSNLVQMCEPSLLKYPPLRAAAVLLPGMSL